MKVMGKEKKMQQNISILSSIGNRLPREVVELPNLEVATRGAGNKQGTVANPHPDFERNREIQSLL